MIFHDAQEVSYNSPSAMHNMDPALDASESCVHCHQTQPLSIVRLTISDGRRDIVFGKREECVSSNRQQRCFLKFASKFGL